jgi:hypothetical protein
MFFSCNVAFDSVKTFAEFPKSDAFLARLRQNKAKVIAIPVVLSTWVVTNFDTEDSRTMQPKVHRHVGIIGEKVYLAEVFAIHFIKSMNANIVFYVD